MTLLIEEDTHGEVVRTSNVDHVGLRVFDVRLTGVFVFNCERRRRRQDHRQQVTRKLGVVDPALHSFHLLGRALAAWPPMRKTMPPPPPLFPLHALSPFSPRVLIMAVLMSAGIHRVFDQVLVWQRDADLAIAAHLAIAKHAAVLTVDLQALDFL